MRQIAATWLLGAFVLTSWAQDIQEPILFKSSRSRVLLDHDLIAFHKNLTEIESITYNEGAVGKWLAESLESQGYNVEKQYVDRENDRFNVFAYPGTSGDTKVLVSSHIDTVSIQSAMSDPCAILRNGRSHLFIHTNTITERSVDEAP